MATPTLSIIIGAQNARQTVETCLQAVIAQAGNAEIILVDSSTDGTADIVARFPQVKLIRSVPDKLVPEGWKIGLDAAQNEIVVFTIAQCIPLDGWIQQITAAFSQPDSGTTAAYGGPIEGPEGSKGLDWALYFARYSAYLPPGARRKVQDIAGDNGAYQRASLLRCADAIRDGFWETLAHDCMRANGETLEIIPEMRVRLGPSGPLMKMAGLRLRHGRYYGSTRPGNMPMTRIVRAAASPLLVPILLWRILGRVRRQRPDWISHFYRALPALFVLVCAWALGEASGYLAPPPRKT